jgi:hypothetical protein
MDSINQKLSLSRGEQAPPGSARNGRDRDLLEFGTPHNINMCH